MANSASLGTSVPVLAVVNGVPTTTSLDVARHFGKRHDVVLRAIAHCSTRCGREDPANNEIRALLDSITIGQALAHQYFNQVRVVGLLLSSSLDVIAEAHVRLQGDLRAAGKGEQA